MKFKFLLLYSITILIVIGSFTEGANAAISDSFLVSISPQNPAPYENVTVTLKSFVNNLDSVLISWSVDGKTAISGIGKKSFSLTAPAAGAEVTVIATISLPSGPTDAKITIKPSVMVLLWQANDSYVPPFYKGKALPTADSVVKVVAMPEIRNGLSLVSAQNMTYKWKKDYTNNVDGSGYGKNFFLYSTDYLEDSNNISVVAATVDQQSSSDGSIDIGMTTPKILFYKRDSIQGTDWNTALPDTYKIAGPEVVQAAPYFISPEELLTPTLVWSWFINDESVNLNSFVKYLMPLSTTEGTHGTSKLRLDIENQSKIFVTTSKEINIEY